MNTAHPSLTEQLFAAFPEWQSLARTETDEEGEAYVVVNVGAPEGADVEHGLVVDTENEEVTVAFDFNHTHFSESAGYGDHLGFEGAVTLIKALMEERVLAVSWWNGLTWRGSIWLEASAEPPVPHWAEPGTYNRVRIRSWKGTRNADRDV